MQSQYAATALRPVPLLQTPAEPTKTQSTASDFHNDSLA